MFIMKKVKNKKKSLRSCIVEGDNYYILSTYTHIPIHYRQTEALLDTRAEELMRYQVNHPKDLALSTKLKGNI